MSLHLGKCNKTAIILSENMALEFFENMMSVSMKQPAFYVKDIIHENLAGYRYTGCFPQSILQRIRFSFQPGIIEWWQKLNTARQVSIQNQLCTSCG